MAKSSHVPSQYLGYSIQTTRMVCLLLDSPGGSSVSVEVFEDVGVTYENGEQRAQQIKSITSSHNPVSDFSIEFWKTLCNWLDSVEQGELIAETTSFEIYISKHQKGDLVNRLSSAKTEDDVAKVLKEFETSYADRKSELSKDAVGYIEKFLSFDRSKVLLMLQNFRLCIGAGNVTLELVNSLRKDKAIPDDIVDDVGYHLLGWVKSTTDTLLQNKKAAVVKEEDFRGELQAIIRKLDRANILQCFAPDPLKEEIEGQKVKTYVLQLGIIDANEETKLQAINDYLKAANNRVAWSKKGLVSYTTFQDYENRLKRTWSNTKERISLTHKNLDDVEKGKLVFLECSEYKTDLQGQSPAEGFISGSFHTLSDKLVIGWHPSYKKLLQDE
jgi:hypothetical protein